MFAIPYIFLLIVIVISGQAADRIRAKKILSTTAVRKIQTAIGRNVLFDIDSNQLNSNRWNWFIDIFGFNRLCWLWSYSNNVLYNISCCIHWFSFQWLSNLTS